MKQEKLFPLALALLALVGLPRLSAQVPNVPDPTSTVPGVGVGALDRISMDLFNAVRTLSTQARYTQGLFTSDVDDYIDVNAYDPAIGTFFFLGASPVGNNVITTNPINGLSFGFARSFSNFYLGLYFGGQLVGARGQSDSGNGTLQAGSDKKASWATSNWDISLAILYGSEALGGIRLDLTLIGTDTISTFDGKTIGNGNTNASYGNRYTTGGLGAIIAGSWGKDLNDTLAAHATLGFRFPDYVLYSNPSAPSGTLSKRTTYSNAMWIINSGIAYDLNEVSTLEADLSLGGDFGSVTTPDVGSKTTEPGSFGLVVDAALVNIFTPVAGLELGLKPYAGLGFVADPGEVLADAGRFEFALGVDAGLKAQLPGKLNKLSVVTGAGLNIFDWRTISNSDTPSPSKEGSAFWIGGIGWKDETLGPSGQLGIGLVLDPSPNLSIGFGINALLDGLFIVDLTTMRVTPGSFFAGGTPGGFLTGLFDSSVSIDLTVSYKF